MAEPKHTPFTLLDQNTVKVRTSLECARDNKAINPHTNEHLHHHNQMKQRL